MDRTITLGVLAACAGLAACGGGGNDPVVVAPTADAFDSDLPFGTAAGTPSDMLTANLDGVSGFPPATITFNGDGTYAIDLPGPGGPITIADTSRTVGPAPDNDLGTTASTYEVLDGVIDVHLGEDDLGNDLFILASVEEDTFATGTLAFVVFGDETTTLPGGSGTYTGGFISEVFDVGGNPVSQMTGNTTIAANFAGNSLSITLNQTGEAVNATLTGTATIAGSQYTGTIASTGGVTNYSGDVIGAFYGPSAEATAGVFHATDAGGAGTADDLEVIGGFTGFLP